MPDIATWFLIALFVVGALAWASGLVALQKLWWYVLVPSWALSNLFSSHSLPPWLMTFNASVDIVLMGVSMLVLSGHGHRNTLFLICLTYIAMLTSHVGWLAHWSLVHPASNYYYQACLNILTALQLMIIGGRCVPLAYDRLRYLRFFFVRRHRHGVRTGK